MPRPALRTRSRKRSPKRLPSGAFTVHYKKETAGAPRCTRCGGVLAGVPRLTPSKAGKLTASQKRIQRMYGGHLCHSCLRDMLKQAARARAP